MLGLVALVEPVVAVRRPHVGAWMRLLVCTDRATLLREAEGAAVEVMVEVVVAVRNGCHLSPLGARIGC